MPVMLSIRFAYLAIDAPERGQFYGTRSRQNLGNLVFGKQAKVGDKRDQYGRIVGKVLVLGQDVSDCPS
jgi:endonuclease YncB( thermonuclease family)